MGAEFKIELLPQLSWDSFPAATGASIDQGLDAPRKNRQSVPHPVHQIVRGSGRNTPETVGRTLAFGHQYLTMNVGGTLVKN